MTIRIATARTRAILLVLPLFFFMIAFFVWPLATVMKQAVSDNSAARVLPLTQKAVTGWDGQSGPTADMERALVADLRGSTDQQAVGEMTRRLNSVHPGFRSLLGLTQSAIAATGQPVDLSAVDARWNDPQTWKTIAGALSPITDRNVLASVDLERNPLGAIVDMPAGSSANRAIMGRTFLIAATVTLACIVIGYPYALVMATTSGWKRNVLLGAILLPLWTSLLVRTTAWFILLQENGLINRFMLNVHLINTPLSLIFNRSGVVIAMTHVLLPLMVLPAYSVILGIPRHLTQAAGSLGASPLRAFFEVLLPLSLRGVASGALLVFMSAVGYYITPALIGGPTDQMISSVIAFYAMGTANWGMASALGLVLLVITVLLYTAYRRLTLKWEAVK